MEDLTENTPYKVTVQACDYSSNKSEFNLSKEFTTSMPLTGPGEWKIPDSEFVDYTAWPTPNIIKYREATGLTGYFLGFVTGADGKACWGGNLSIYDGDTGETHDGDVTVSKYKKAEIKELRDMGGEVIMSFGGASNAPIEEAGRIKIKNIQQIKEIYAKKVTKQTLNELEKELQKYLDKADGINLSEVNSIIKYYTEKPSIETLTSNTSKIINIYLKAIENYNLTYIDFDFEGGFLGNTAALETHIAAITEVIKQKPNLKISYTLPVDGAPGLMGLNAAGEAFLIMLHEAGINPSLINAMSMEFGEGSSNNLFECVKLSIEGQEIPGDQNAVAHRGLHKQIKEIYGDIWNDEEIYQHIGICPMFGRNNNRKIFNLKDQANLNTYAKEKGIKNLNGWDASRDMNPTKLDMDSDEPKPGSFGKLISEFSKFNDDEVEITGSCAA
ncbi:MAG TPA: hypothetical protein LFW21_06660 [Rickettsia endosymbiont of Pyrocoelia pectoralis]|nr:hypothetical protein [Rickettsia endosymbiont of Pyrocoelia pectoralis]